MAVGAARTMVCYKETHATVKVDPVADEWTGTWRDGRAYNPVGAQPENGLSGTIYMVDTWANYPILVPHAYAAHRFWRHTAVEKTPKDGHSSLMKGAIGHVRLPPLLTSLGHVPCPPLLTSLGHVHPLSDSKTEVSTRALVYPPSCAPCARVATGV